MLLSGLRAGFVSHDISLSGTLCLSSLQVRVGTSEQPTKCSRLEAKIGVRSALCDAV